MQMAPCPKPLDLSCFLFFFFFQCSLVSLQKQPFQLTLPPISNSIPLFKSSEVGCLLQLTTIWDNFCRIWVSTPRRLLSLGLNICLCSTAYQFRWEISDRQRRLSKEGVGKNWGRGVSAWKQTRKELDKGVPLGQVRKRKAFVSLVGTVFPFKQSALGVFYDTASRGSSGPGVPSCG